MSTIDQGNDIEAAEQKGTINGGDLEGSDDLNNGISNGSSSSFAPTKEEGSKTDAANSSQLKSHRSSSSSNNNKEKATTKSLPPLLQKVVDKVGKIDESRIVSTPEYLSGEIPQLYSNLEYKYKTTKHDNGTQTETITTAQPSTNTNVITSSALLCGTALGCGLVTLPTAIDSGAGYVPTAVASLVAWAYMTISALLTSELLINRSGETGRVRNVGLLELYTSYLGEFGGKAAGIGFLLVSYIVMGVYLSEGGDMLMRMLEMTTHAASESASSAGASGVDITAAATATASSAHPLNINNEMITRTIFAAVVGSFLAISAKLNNVQRAMTHFFVPITLLAFLSAIAIGLPTIDFKCLFASQNQHPEVVLNSFPLLFMSWTYHGVVPRVVYDLEGDKNKITQAIIVGSTTALVMYGLWTAMVLGNAMGDGSIDEHVVETLSNAASSVVGSLQTSSGVVLGEMLGMEDGSTSALSTATSLSHYQFSQQLPLLQPAVEIVTEMAVVTSLIGVVLGFVNEFNDAVGTLPSKSYGPKEDNKWKLALLTLLPPAMISIGLGYYSGIGTFDVNNYEILDYTGIFGSSILFLILPAQLAWKNRYGDDDRPLTVMPMVPLGKIPLGSLYKAAGTLIIEQGLEKLGVFEFVKEQWSNFSG